MGVRHREQQAPRKRPPFRNVGREPDYRFSLANERTFLAWISTALALVAGGVALTQLVIDFAVPGGRRLLSVALIGLGIVVAATSHRRWQRVERAMRLDQPLPPTQLPLALAAGVTVFSLLVLVRVMVE